MSDQLFKNLSTHNGIWAFYTNEGCDGIMFKDLSDRYISVLMGVWHINGVQEDRFEWEFQGKFRFKKGELDITNLDLRKAYALAEKKGLVC